MQLLLIVIPCSSLVCMYALCLCASFALQSHARPATCVDVQAATGTVDGKMILWTASKTHSNGTKFRQVNKVISIHSSLVRSLSCVDRFLVSGAGDGYVRFFDSNLRLVAWFEVGCRCQMHAEMQ